MITESASNGLPSVGQRPAITLQSWDVWESWTQSKARSSAINPALTTAATRLVEEVEVEGTEVVGNPMGEHFGWADETSQGGYRSRLKHGWGFVQWDGSPWGGYQWDGTSFDDSGNPCGKDGGKLPKRATPGSSRLYFAPIPNEIRLAIDARCKGDTKPPDKGFWQWVADNTDLPLVLTEGALKAMCLLSHGYIALAVNGCWGALVSSKRDPDFPHGRLDTELVELVRDRDVLLAFDADWDSNPNVWQATDKTATLLGHAGANVKICVWESGLGKGVDDLISAHGVEAFRPWAALTHGEWCRRHPRPKEKPNPEEVLAVAHEAQEFAKLCATRLNPYQLFPQPLADALMGASHSLCVGVEGLIAPMLSITGSLIGAGNVVQPKPDWTVRPNLWTVVEAKSGQAKSPAKTAVQKPLDLMQAEAAKSHLEAMEQYDRDLDQWNRNKSKGGEYEPAPKPPVKREYWTGDGTIEGISALHNTEVNRRGVVLIQDELSGFILGMNQYKGGGKGNDRQLWLTLADGTPFKRTFKTYSIDIPEPSLSIYGGVQPSVLDRIAEASDDDGLWSRFLWFSLPYTPRKWVPNPPDLTKVLTPIYSRLESLAPNNIFELSPEALARFITVWEKWGNMSFELPSGMDNAYAKMARHCLAVALNLHLIEWATLPTGLPSPSLEISLVAIEGAIALCEYSLSVVTRRNKDMLTDLHDRQGILIDISQKLEPVNGGWVKVRDVISRIRGKKGARLNSQDVKGIFSSLVELGIGEVRQGARGSLEWRYSTGTDPKNPNADKNPYADKSAAFVSAFPNPCQSGDTGTNADMMTKDDVFLGVPNNQSSLGADNSNTGNVSACQHNSPNPYSEPETNADTNAAPMSALEGVSAQEEISTVTYTPPRPQKIGDRVRYTGKGSVNGQSMATLSYEGLYVHDFDKDKPGFVLVWNDEWVVKKEPPSVHIDDLELIYSPGRT
jgi:hypothetical protein